LHSDSKTRVGAAIQNAETDGIKVELQLIDFAEFSFNRVDISPSSLTNPFHRKAMENLAILDSDVSGLRPLNRGRDTAAKVFEKLCKDRRKLYTPEPES
jgi:hypothetical protein